MLKYFLSMVNIFKLSLNQFASVATVRGVREVFLRDGGGPTRRVVWRVCLVLNGDGRRAGGERENA